MLFYREEVKKMGKSILEKIAKDVNTQECYADSPGYNDHSGDSDHNKGS
jgi:hypothetical protein